MKDQELSLSSDQLFLSRLNKTKAYLHFENGTSFEGFLNLEENDSRLKDGIWGEAAFTTGMSGNDNKL